MKLKFLHQVLTMSKYLFYGLFLQALLSGMLIANDGVGQKTSIYDVYVDITFKESSLSQAVELLEKKTEFGFAYNQNDVYGINKKVNATFSGASLGDVLSFLSKEMGVIFRRVNGNITVRKQEETSIPLVEEVDAIVKQVRISGKVTAAEDNEPLPGVSILVKGTSSGTTTDVDGNYSLSAPEGSILQFSYIGFVTQEITVGSQTTLNVVMQADLEQLEEVIVVGYGAVKKSDLTGSVSSVKEEELTAFPAIDAAQALQGRAAGVQITANNGAPGSDYKVRVRGATSINASSDPLFVVDGLVGGVLPPPEDIASIEVLKDASATAMYGSRGANGVFLVTTKRGSSGKTQINFSSSYSVQETINTLDMLNGDQFVDFLGDASVPYTRFAGPNGETYNTNWQDELFTNGSIQNYNLSISGGTEKMKYYVSGVYYDQQGVIESSSFDRFSVTSNLDFKATDKLKFGANLFARRSNREGVTSQERSGGAGSYGIINSALLMEPDKPILDANGNFVFGGVSVQFDNPLSQVSNVLIEGQEDRFQTNLYADYEILKGLSFKTTFGFTNNESTNGSYSSTNTLLGSAVGGIGSAGSESSSTLLNENYLTYTKEVGDHNFTVLGGYSYQKTTDEFLFAGAQGFVSNSLSYRNLGAASTFTSMGSGIVESEIASWYGRMNYSLKGKYLIQVNGRYDGASVFAENNKWAFFPSVALGWNVKDESFLSSVDAITDLKLRTSFGITGNQAISPYSSLARVLGSGQALAVQNNQLVNALLPQTFANPDLTWETTTQTNIGLDLSILGGKLNLTVDYYRMLTEDLLFDVPLNRTVGYINLFYTTNLGQVENQGFEFTLSSVNIDKEFKWTTDFNISTNRNKVLELPNGLDVFSDASPTNLLLDQTLVLREGQPVGSFFGYEYTGVIAQDITLGAGSDGSFETQAGGEGFRDTNGRDDNGELTGEPDGILNADDRTIIGDPNPDFIWGLNNNFSYKGFDLNIFFQASVGNDIYNFTRMQSDLGNGFANGTTALLDRWTPSNPNGSEPAANGGRIYRSSSRFVEDGSFVRLKNIALGYNFSESVLSALKIQRLRVYVSGQNLLTFTDYTGFDPEVSWAGSNGNSANQGLDFGSYPNAKGFTFGLNVGF